MLTTCPECRTTFRIVHAQLEERRGMVRCGYCRAVFNAYDTLLPEFDQRADTAPPPAAEAGYPALARDDDVRDREAGIAGPEPGPEPPAASPSPATLPGPAVPAAPGTAAEAMPAAEPPAATRPPPDRPPAGTADAILLTELPTRAQIEPGGHPLRGFLLGALNLLLILLVLAQAAYFLRAPLVAWLPESRPVFVRLCAELGCAVPLPRQLAAFRVESSSLETDPEQPSRATLRLSLSNRSEAEQAWPHLVLKLTDLRGAPLAQRAFAPADYLPGGTRAGTGMAPMSEREFQLDLDLGGLSAAGYEVRPQYP